MIHARYNEDTQAWTVYNGTTVVLGSLSQTDANALVFCLINYPNDYVISHNA